MNNFYIYTIFNSINGKIYVGKSKNPAKRFDKHLKIASGARTKEKFVIHKAIDKYGKDNFRFSILQAFNDEKDCSDAERYWIKYFKSNIKEFGYNLTDGGEGTTGRVVSEKTRAKMRSKAIGRKHTAKTIEKLKKINLGKIPVNLEQLRTINIGRPLSEEHKNKISESKIWIKFSKEHKLNMSIANNGTRVGANNPFYGKTHTEKIKENSRGENNKQTKLTEQKVIEIRKLYNSGNYTHQQLANKYNISREQIGRIVRRIDWKHIKENNE